MAAEDLGFRSRGDQRRLGVNPTSIVDSTIAQTQSYIRDFAEESKVAEIVDNLVSAMTAKYSQHGNLWTLQFSASNVIAHRDGGDSLIDIS
ncbi:hypothetical protein [Mycobacterium montefiorense]|uniref:hypothetical protein n=1 Tax=Mycobacterium montefiorense TaxID=154654 RepID=UPI0021DBD803|nr:hypothetical protein [Mycobacterium montefiorense]MCV7425155.1 hypothetical protein [Mycobacterium montefiorense]GLE50703.1 hypothetical protein ATCCBAA256_02900 [Mycobacterium montefiorense]